MKPVHHFIIQAKGGSGKSMLTALLALKHQDDGTSYFIDLCSAASTSLQQLTFLKGQKPSRFATVKLLDGRNKFDRQMLLEQIIKFNEKGFENYFWDFGATESAGLLALLQNDYTAEDLLQIQQEVGCKFVFNIVMAGGSAYEACTSYLSSMAVALKDFFDIHILINEHSFFNYSNLVDELHTYATNSNGSIHSVQRFGDFDTTTLPHKNILKAIEKGVGMSAFGLIERLKILKELKKLS